MSTLVETIPTTWSDERDGAYFHLTARLFTAEFCDGASVLLASYDDEMTLDRPTVEPTATPYRSIRTDLSAQH